MREPLSTVSNAAYLGAAAVVLYFDRSAVALIFAVALVLLALGSGWMHATSLKRHGETLIDPAAEALDHAGMHAALAALATYAVGGGPLLVLAGSIAAPLALELYFDVRIEVAVALYLWFAGVGLVLAGAFASLLIGLALFGAGYALWHRHTDAAHALWHLLTAAGLAVLFLGAG